MRKKVQTAKQSLFFKYQSFQKDTPIKTKKQSKTFLHPLSGNDNEIIIIVIIIMIIIIEWKGKERNLRTVTCWLNCVKTIATAMVRWFTKMRKLFNIFAPNSKVGEIHSAGSYLKYI